MTEYQREIEVCGSKPCIDCAGTGNKNFPKGGATTSRHSCPYPCASCKGSGMITYFEKKLNPDYVGEYNEFNKYMVDILHKLKAVRILKDENIKKYCYETYSQIIKNRPESIAKTKCLNLIEEIKKDSMISAINSSSNNFSSNNTNYSHIGSKSKINFSLTNFEEWITDLELLDRIRGSITMERALSELDDRRKAITIAEKYKEYILECKKFNVTPSSFPNIECLNRWVRYVTIKYQNEDEEKIYNPYYINSSGCSVM